MKISNALSSNPGQDTGWYDFTSFYCLFKQMLAKTSKTGHAHLLQKPVYFTIQDRHPILIKSALPE